MPKPPSDQPNIQVTPKPELEMRTHRKSTTEYKLRILAEADACQHGIPRLEATKLNEVWTWDIAKLATKRRGAYLCL